MSNSLRSLLLAVLTLVLAAPATRADEPETPKPPAVPGIEPRVVLHWNDPQDTTTVHYGAARAPLEFVATIADLDSIMGFEIEIHVSRSKESTVWRFVALDDCPVAVLDVDAMGTRAVPAPWRSKLFLSDARELEAGKSRIMALGAFHREPLDTSSTYTLCRFRLNPPAAQSADCAGWDDGATFEMVRVIYLRDRGKEIPVTRLGGPLVFRIQPD